MKAKAPQADIDRVSSQIAPMLPKNITYEWVASHQEESKSWAELLLEEQLNTECDLIVKAAIRQSLEKPRRKQADQLLLLRPAAVKLEGRTHTSDPTAVVRRVINRREAKKTTGRS